MTNRVPEPFKHGSGEENRISSGINISRLWKIGGLMHSGTGLVTPWLHIVWPHITWVTWHRRRGGRPWQLSNQPKPEQSCLCAEGFTGSERILPIYGACTEYTYSSTTLRSYRRRTVTFVHGATSWFPGPSLIGNLNLQLSLSSGEEGLRFLVLFRRHAVSATV